MVSGRVGFKFFPVIFAVWLLKWQVITREEEVSQAVFNLKLTKAE